MDDEIKKKTLNALFWSFIERFSHQILQFFFSIFLARLLLPEEFGLIAMITVFIVIGNSFINAGFGHALIQKKNADKIDESSIFYFNIIIALFVSLILYNSSELISTFYNEPILNDIIKFLPLALIFNALGLVQRTLLSKTLDFKTQMKASILTSLISGSLAVYLALNGYGVWSLVTLLICTDFFNTFFLWIFCPWRPIFVFSLDSLKSMFGFGSKLFIVSITNSIFTNIYVIVIGKIFSPSSLGFYHRAETFYKYPVVLINSVVSQVTFPVFSKIQQDKVSLRFFLKQAITQVTFITFPLMIGLMVVANPLIEIVLTEKWLPSVTYLQFFCLIGAMYPILAINLNALNALGRSDLYLKVDFINKAIIIVTILVSYKFGIITMIIGQIINSFIAFYLYSFYIGKLLNYPFLSQIRDIFPAFLISMTMGALTFLLKFLNIENQLLLLIIQISSGVTIYVLLCYLTKIKSFMNILNMIRTKTKFL
jgi:O-antigen/teichoic acid export membrane protein